MNRILTSKKALAAFLGTAVVELTTNRCMSVLRRLILTMMLVFPLMLLAAPPAKTAAPARPRIVLPLTSIHRSPGTTPKSTCARVNGCALM